MNKVKEAVQNLRKIREYRVIVRMQDFKKETFWARARSKAHAEEQILQLLEDQGKGCYRVEFLKRGLNNVWTYANKE